jgi:hypothetical protein
LVALLGLAGPLVALVAIVAADLRERNRQKHDQKMQLVELEAQRLSKLREDRLQAYSTMARRTKVIEPTRPPKVADLVETLSEIELLTDDPQLLETAGKLVPLAERTRAAAQEHQEGRKTPAEVERTLDELTECRREFIRLTKEELARTPAIAGAAQPRSSWWRRIVS